MARPRAADYDDKRRAILKRAAQLFAAQGFDRTSMAEIALALGVSKALFYHYYGSKDALLFDIIRSHLVELVDAAEAADDATLPPRLRLERMIAAILDLYRDADAEHKVQIGHLAGLPGPQQAELRALERRLVDLMAGIVRALNPALPERFIKPAAMSIFGTVNWKYMWFRSGGPVTEEEYALLTADVFAAGIAGLAQS
jgi:TetR/AcrR family transcriptional regulator